jgi:DNA-binding cell septation regulator SpoVG
MQITNVRVYPKVQGTLRSHADVTFDNCLCIKEFRLLRVRGAYVLCMPYEKEKDGSIRDLAYPASDSTLQMIQKAVIAEYEKITGPRTRSKRRVWLLASSSMPAL